MGDRWQGQRNNFGQQQMQTQQYQQSQVLNELRYTINQDMQNMLGICLEFFAVEESKGSLDPELVKVQKNRLILQYNLSNTIHYDQEQTAWSKKLDNDLKNAKLDAQKMFLKIRDQLIQEIPKFQGSDAFEILKDYEQNNLAISTRIIQKQPEKVAVKGNFNENVLSQVIGSMQQTDLKYDQIRNYQGSIQLDDDTAILKKTMYRYENAKSKLSPQSDKHQNPLREQKIEEESSIPSQQMTDNSQIVSNNLLGGLLMIQRNKKGVYLQLITTYIKLIYTLQNKQQIKQDFLKTTATYQSFTLFNKKFDEYLHMGGEQLLNNLGKIIQSLLIPDYEVRNFNQIVPNTEQFWISKEQTYQQLRKQLFNGLLQNYNSGSQIQLKVNDAYDQYLMNSIIECELQVMVSVYMTNLLTNILRQENHRLDKSNSQTQQQDISYIKQQLSSLNQF